MSDNSYGTESEKDQRVPSTDYLRKVKTSHSQSIKILARALLISATLMCTLAATSFILAKVSPEIKDAINGKLLVSGAHPNRLNLDLKKLVSAYFWVRILGFIAIWVTIPSNKCFLLNS